MDDARMRDRSTEKEGKSKLGERALRSLSSPTRERFRLLWKRSVKTWQIFRRNRLGMVGLVILIFFLVMAAFS